VADCDLGVMDAECRARGPFAGKNGFAAMPGARHPAGGCAMIDERLTTLLDAYLDGSLSAEEKKELERMLLESDAARRQFWERASLHGWTYAAAKLNYSARPAEEVARERRQLRGVSFAGLLNRLRNANRPGWRLAFTGALCIAAVMAWNRFHQAD